jgi:drug/metabolite transporter (DMT)-like permease
VQAFTFGTFLVAFTLVLLLTALRLFKDLPTRKGSYHLLRGITGIAGFTLFIAAAQLTSLVDTNVLVNTTPIFIPILALIFLRQRISWQIWLAIVIGFAGMVVVVRPDANILSNPGNLVALAAGFVTAIEFLAVNILDESESPLTQLFYFLLFGVVVSGGLAIGHFQATPPWVLCMMAATGLCLLAFQFLLIKAYLYAKPHEVGAFQYSSVVFAAIFGIVLFRESISLESIIGAVMICAGGIVSFSGRH